MATLTDSDYTEIARIIRNDPTFDNTFRSWSFSRPTWKALFQAAETWFTGAFNTTPSTSFKAALDAVATTTANQAKWIGRIWFEWRLRITW